MSEKWGDSQRDRDALDRHITGNYGEDQFKMTDELIHTEALTEAMERVVTMTNNALDAFGEGQTAEAIMALWENVGICAERHE